MNHPKLFSKLERNIAELQSKTTRNDRDQILPKIEQTLKQIFNIEVMITLDYTSSNNDTCIVMCYPILPKEFLDFNRNPNLHFIHINFGIKLLNLLEPREVIAVLLHEYRHWHYNYETRLPQINAILSGFRYLSGSGLILFATTLPLISMFLLLLIIATTSSNLLKHNIEYGCDEYAVELGYGADLYSAFRKLHSFEKEDIFITSLIKTILESLFGSTHPSFESRLEKIVDYLKNKYKDVYNTPKQKKLIEKYYQIKV